MLKRNSDKKVSTSTPSLPFRKIKQDVHQRIIYHDRAKEQKIISCFKKRLLFVLVIFWTMVVITLITLLPPGQTHTSVVVPTLDKRGSRLLELRKSVKGRGKIFTREEMQFLVSRDRYGIIPPKKSTANQTYSEKQQQQQSSEATNVLKNLRAKSIILEDDTNRTYCKCVDCDTDTLCGGLWRGDLVSPAPKKFNFTISIVLSHCNKSLDWLEGFVGKVPLVNFTILSKCNAEVKHAPKNAVILRLPNIGRCDHSYAYYMARMKKLPPQIDSNKHIHVFLKDSRFIHQDGDLRTLKEIIELVHFKGFACGLTCPYQMSIFHKTSVLRRFALDIHRKTPDLKKFKSPFLNMGAWLDVMNISLPIPYTPVCYSGIFAVQTSRILSLPRSFWSNIEKSLSRGNSIEEGHFTERLWSALFSNRLLDYEMQGITDYMETYNGACCYNGALMHDIYDDL